MRNRNDAWRDRDRDRDRYDRYDRGYEAGEGERSRDLGDYPDYSDESAYRRRGRGDLERGMYGRDVNHRFGTDFDYEAENVRSLWGPDTDVRREGELSAPRRPTRFGRGERYENDEWPRPYDVERYGGEPFRGSDRDSYGRSRGYGYEREPDRNFNRDRDRGYAAGRGGRDSYGRNERYGYGGGYERSRPGGYDREARYGSESSRGREREPERGYGRFGERGEPRRYRADRDEDYERTFRRERRDPYEEAEEQWLSSNRRKRNW